MSSRVTAEHAARLLADATPGPWIENSCGYGNEGRSHWIGPVDQGPPDCVACWHVSNEHDFAPMQGDVDLVVAAPDLARTVIVLETKIAAYVRAVEKYDAARRTKPSRAKERDEMRAALAALREVAGR